jgi:hypothetical protein
MAGLFFRFSAISFIFQNTIDCKDNPAGEKENGKRQKAMAKVDRITISLGLVALFLVLIGISFGKPLLPPEPPEGAIEPELSFASACAYDPDSRLGPSPEGRMMHREGMPPFGVPVEMILGGGGLALRDNDNESHLFRLSIVRLSPLEPGRVRDLLVSNKSIEEIRKAIKAEEGEALYRGSMRLDDIIYPLIDIEIRPSENNVTLVDADVTAPGSDPEKQTDVVGHFAITVSATDGVRIGDGQLDMSSKEDSGSYKILLKVAGNSMLFEESKADGHR